MFSRFRRFLRENIELVGIVPGLLLALGGVWFWTWWNGLPGIELSAILTDYLVALPAVALIGYMAWRWKKEYWYDLSDEDEDRLHTDASHGNWLSFWIIVKDRLEWLVLFAVIYGAFSSFAGASVHPSTPYARDLIVRWEITSETAYNRRYARPVWPGGQSGITWGVGYDGGHQPAHVIVQDWQAHAEAKRLAGTAGLIGQAAQKALPQFRDIVTPWPLAVEVLDNASLPRYRAQARQAYGRHFDSASPWVQGALTSMTYNRGPSMAGERRRELRYIRDVCLPRGDDACVAEQILASCWVWANDNANGPGLCNRRKDEARVARG